MGYLEQFLKDKIAPYRAAVEAIPLEFRTAVTGEIENIFAQNVSSSVDKNELVVPTALDERLILLYSLTAQLGWDFGRLLSEKSGPHIRIGEDYAVVYGEVMALFGKSKEQATAEILECLKREIQRDRILRYMGIGPQHVLAWLN